MASPRSPAQRSPRGRDERNAHDAVNDAKASRGSDFARGGNTSAEGNDPSLTHGPTRRRKVPRGT